MLQIPRGSSGILRAAWSFFACLFSLCLFSLCWSITKRFTVLSVGKVVACNFAQVLNCGLLLVWVCRPCFRGMLPSWMKSTSVTWTRTVKDSRQLIDSVLLVIGFFDKIQFFFLHWLQGSPEQKLLILSNVTRQITTASQTSSPCLRKTPRCTVRIKWPCWVMCHLENMSNIGKLILSNDFFSPSCI